ncbi:transcriptional regulator [Sphaerimonospora sp. CA-214678]|uniref:transcriptional regulator n=1 Tax=Sphaerimonospora sp. CA-214678 TaxID=3240029 RepID=UPI003D925C0A
MNAELPPWAVRLRAERRNRLWSQKEMARRLVEAADEETRRGLPVRETIVRRIKAYEAGHNQPRDPYRLLYVRVFGISEAELFDTPQAPKRPTVDNVLTKIPDSDSLTPLTVRTGRRIGMSTITDLSARVHRLRLADDVLAGGDLLQPAFRELNAATRLYREATYTEHTGRILLSVIGELAQITGWIASDAGRHQEAAKIYRLGIRAAQEAGDGTLESNLLGSLAYQTANIGDPHEGVTLAHAALKAAGPHAPARARALAWDRVAWAHVRVEEIEPAIRALGEASTALEQHGGEDEPAYLYWVDTNELQIMEARAYTELRRPLRAVPVLTDVLARYDTTHARELALYLSWLAAALADANEPEEAARAARRMFDLSKDVASDRTTRRHRVVLDRLAPYRDVPQVRELINQPI